MAVIRLFPILLLLAACSRQTPADLSLDLGDGPTYFASIESIEECEKVVADFNQRRIDEQRKWEDHLGLKWEDLIDGIKQTRIDTQRLIEYHQPRVDAQRVKGYLFPGGFHEGFEILSRLKVLCDPQTASAPKTDSSDGPAVMIAASGEFFPLGVGSGRRVAAFRNMQECWRVVGTLYSALDWVPRKNIEGGGRRLPICAPLDGTFADCLLTEVQDRRGSCDPYGSGGHD